MLGFKIYTTCFYWDGQIIFKQNCEGSIFSNQDSYFSISLDDLREVHRICESYKKDGQWDYALLEQGERI
jgi:hypothetical protein